MRTKFHSRERFPLHISGKISDFHWFDEEMPFVWSVFNDVIDEMQADYNLVSHALVVLNNHYHWICTYDFKKDPHFFEFCEEIINMNLLSTIGPGRTLSTFPKVIEVRHFEYYKTLYRYIYRNPVDAGLCFKAHHYPYSTLPYLLGRKGLEFKVRDNMNLIGDPFNTLSFINSDVCEDKGAWFKDSGGCDRG